MTSTTESVTLSQSQVPHVVSRSALRAQLEETRAAVHALLDSASGPRWREKSPSTRWTVAELFVHLTWALEYLPQEVQRARQGKGMFNMPKWLADPLSYWYIRWNARNATPQAVGLRYDKAMDSAIAAVEAIPDDEWQRGADFYSEGFHTVEDLFHAPREHFEQHMGGI